MRATHVCCIVYYCKLMACSQAISKFSFRPNAPSGHYQRHFDLALKDKLEPPPICMDVPGCEKHSKFERVTLQVPMVPLQSCFQQELEENPLMVNELHASIAQAEWSSQYYKHPVVTSNAGLSVLPWALYLDGVPFTKRDGCISFFGVNLLTRARHNIANLRKSDLCRCGCRGWCSLYPVLMAINWMLVCLATGELVDVSFIKILSTFASCRLRAALIHIKGDWKEICDSLGFPNWSSALHPCFCCFATRAELREIGSLNPDVPDSVVFEPKTHEQYERECDACEKHVRILDASTQQMVERELFYDRRKSGGHGRCLKRNIACLDLKAGDRLEPSIELMDVGQFEKLTPPTHCDFLARCEPNYYYAQKPALFSIYGLRVIFDWYRHSSHFAPWCL